MIISSKYNSSNISMREVSGFLNRSEFFQRVLFEMKFKSMELIYFTKDVRDPGSERPIDLEDFMYGGGPVYFLKPIQFLMKERGFTWEKYPRNLGDYTLFGFYLRKVYDNPEMREKFIKECYDTFIPAYQETNLYRDVLQKALKKGKFEESLEERLENPVFSSIFSGKLVGLSETEFNKLKENPEKYLHWLDSTYLQSVEALKKKPFIREIFDSIYDTILDAMDSMTFSVRKAYIGKSTTCKGFIPCYMVDIKNQKIITDVGEFDLLNGEIHTKKLDTTNRSALDKYKFPTEIRPLSPINISFKDMAKNEYIDQIRI